MSGEFSIFFGEIFLTINFSSFFKLFGKEVISPAGFIGFFPIPMSRRVRFLVHKPPIFIEFQEKINTIWFFHSTG